MRRERVVRLRPFRDVSRAQTSGTFAGKIKRHSLPVGRIRGSCFSVREPGRGDILRQRPRPETLLSDAADFRRSLRVVPVAFLAAGQDILHGSSVTESAVPSRRTFFRVRTSGRNTAGPQQTERSGTATVRGRAARCSDDGDGARNPAEGAWVLSGRYSCTNRLQPRISLPEMRPWMRNEPSSQTVPRSWVCKKLHE